MVNKLYFLMTISAFLIGGYVSSAQPSRPAYGQAVSDSVAGTIRGGCTKGAQLQCAGYGDGCPQGNYVTTGSSTGTAGGKSKCISSCGEVFANFFACYNSP